MATCTKKTVQIRDNILQVTECRWSCRKEAEEVVENQSHTAGFGNVESATKPTCARRTEVKSREFKEKKGGLPVARQVDNTSGKDEEGTSRPRSGVFRMTLSRFEVSLFPLGWRRFCPSVQINNSPLLLHGHTLIAMLIGG